MMDYEMRLRIINQRGEDNNQISIRYLADHSEVEGSIPAEPRLEDLFVFMTVSTRSTWIKLHKTCTKYNN